MVRGSYLARLAIVIALGLILCVTAGAVYNAVANLYLQHRYPAPGKLFVVNGSKMHLYCTGSGSPTVVLDSGLGDDWLVWQKVQPELSKITHVCSYDRAGLGWSDPQHGPRGALTISEQLHSLLQQARVPGPLLLIGHSAGGLYARAFAGKYPAEVTGIVFVDASSPEAFHALPSRQERDMLRQARHQKAFWLWLNEVTGWQRLSGNCDRLTRKGLEEYANFAKAEACRPPFVNSWLGEWDDFESSADDVAKLSCCGTLPILVISRDPNIGQLDTDAQRLHNPTWASVQESLKNLSTRSRRIIARNSGHYVLIDRPEVITRNVQHLIQELRGLAHGAEDGSTIVQ